MKTAIFTHLEAIVIKRLREKRVICSADIRTRGILIEYGPNKNFDPNYRERMSL